MVSVSNVFKHIIWIFNLLINDILFPMFDNPYKSENDLFVFNVENQLIKPIMFYNTLQTLSHQLVSHMSDILTSWLMFGGQPVHCAESLQNYPHFIYFFNHNSACNFFKPQKTFLFFISINSRIVPDVIFMQKVIIYLK